MNVNRANFLRLLTNRWVSVVLTKASARAKHPPSDKRLASAGKLLEETLRKATAALPVPMSVTISRETSKSPFVAGIITPDKSDLKKHIRIRIYEALPQGKLVKEVYQALEQGREVKKEKLIAAREALYALKGKYIFKIGIHSRVLEKFNYSLPQALMESFPLLGLVREDFAVMDWSTPEKGIRNIRHHVFKYNPGLREEVERVEAIFSEKKPISDDEARFANKVRQILQFLVIQINLDKWGLGAYSSCKHLGEMKGIIGTCFPFVNHPVFDRFFGDYDCADPDDLQKAYISLKERRHILYDKTMFKRRNRNRRIRIAGDSKASLNDLLEKFQKYFYEGWAIGRSMRRRKIALFPEELLGIFFDFVVHRDQTRELIRNELREIYRIFGVINISLVEINCRFINNATRNYGIGIWTDLFGMSFEDYVRSWSFLAGHH